MDQIGLPHRVRSRLKPTVGDRFRELCCTIRMSAATPATNGIRQCEGELAPLTRDAKQVRVWAYILIGLAFILIGLAFILIGLAFILIG